MAVQEKVSETTTIITTAEPAMIIAAADRAAEGAKSMDFRVKRLEGGNDNAATYAVNAAFGGRHLTFNVNIGNPDSDGRRTVDTKIIDYTTSQQKVLMFIPVGPKNVVGLRNYRKFMSNLENELAGV